MKKPKEAYMHPFQKLIQKVGESVLTAAITVLLVLRFTKKWAAAKILSWSEVDADRPIIVRYAVAWNLQSLYAKVIGGQRCGYCEWTIEPGARHGYCEVYLQLQGKTADELEVLLADIRTNPEKYSDGGADITPRTWLSAIQAVIPA
jgi:hypothetical protein